MELKLDIISNGDVEGLQEMAKAVTGKHKSKKDCVLILVDAGIEVYNEGGHPYLCPTGEETAVICSVTFPEAMANEIGRIKAEIQAFWNNEAINEMLGEEERPAPVVNTHDVVNFLCRWGYPRASEPYTAILKQNKVVAI